MKVKELIYYLQKIEDKELPVYIWNDDLFEIDLIDDSIDDRVDINIGKRL